MWKKEEVDYHFGWKEELIAVATIGVTVLYGLLLLKGFIDGLVGNIDGEFAFYKCMSYIGMWLISLIILAKLLDR